MSVRLEFRDGSAAPQFADLMRDLVWAPGYRDADTWFATAYAAAEGIVIHEAARWPAPLAGLRFGAAASELSEDMADRLAEQEQQFQRAMLRDLLDASAGRLVRGYLGVGRALPEAHVLSCALAADVSRRIEICAQASGAMSMASADAVRAPARRFWRQIASSGPFEFLVVVGFLFETLLIGWLAQWPADSRVAWNRHRAKLGSEVLHFILDQDPSNLPLVQSWLNRGTVRCAELFDAADQALLGASESLPRATTAGHREPLTALTAALSDLASYGIEPPSIHPRRRRLQALS